MPVRAVFQIAFVARLLDRTGNAACSVAGVVTSPPGPSLKEYPANGKMTIEDAPVWLNVTPRASVAVAALYDSIVKSCRSELTPAPADLVATPAVTPVAPGKGRPPAGASPKPPSPRPAR